VAERQRHLLATLSQYLGFFIPSTIPAQRFLKA